VGLRLAEKAGRPADPALPRLRAELARDLSIRPFLEALDAPDPAILPPADATPVCRCEEINAGDIRATLRLGAPGANQVKSLIRSGMGPCQGRVCGTAVAAIIAAARGGGRGGAPGPEDYYRIRPPLKPVPIAELADYPAVGEEVEAREP